MGNQRQGTEEFLGGGNCRTTKDGYRVVNDGELGEWHRMTDGKLARPGWWVNDADLEHPLDPTNPSGYGRPGNNYGPEGSRHDERLVDEQKWWCDRVYAHEVAEKHLTGEDARKVRAAWGKKGALATGEAARKEVAAMVKELN